MGGNIIKRLERTRHERASLLSNLGEPLKRNVRCFEVPAQAEANYGSKKVLPISESRLRQLLDALCIEWGFCIPPNASDEIARRATITAEEFAKAVLEAEEMNPEYEQKWSRRIADRFIEEFEK